ncbi:MAG: glycosyltransferase [Nitrosomonas sp.]|nr:glycosyltransferase [Nitrosomonas sp.]
MTKRILMIAYHYPPVLGSSGIQRTLKFAHYLPEFDWEPIILTVHPRAYPKIDNGHIDDEQTRVYRAFAADTAQHLSFMKRYPRLLALPDRWSSWMLGAIPTGMYLIKKYKPSVIWSTYPIATAHLIGYCLHRMSKIPWVSDFRDPMVEPDFPAEPLLRRAYQWIDRNTVYHSHQVILTTPNATKDYQSRYPELPASKFTCIENGYDEEIFRTIEKKTGLGTEAKDQRFVLLHSGIIYSSERDPVQFFEALSLLLQQKLIGNNNLKVVLRATFNDHYITGLIKQYQLESIVFLEPPISYEDALSEMLTVDGLLIIQAANCNSQIPAKLYEYLRARRPILALTDANGDTAMKLAGLGINTIAQLDSKEDIAQKLLLFIQTGKTQSAQFVPTETIMLNSRSARTKELAVLLNAATNSDQL